MEHVKAAKGKEQSKNGYAAAGVKLDEPASLGHEPVAGAGMPLFLSGISGGMVQLHRSARPELAYLTRVDARGSSSPAPASSQSPSAASTPFGHALANAVQRRGRGGGESKVIHQAAAAGVRGPASTLPHLDTIQASFGRHDVSGVRAHTGSEAKEAATSIGASAYATGNGVAFAGAPDLHTAAHEAAHVVQQRAGVQLYGGVGQQGDVYETHADAVADRVLRGESAEGLLASLPGGGSGGGVQRVVQKAPPTEGNEASGDKDAAIEKDESTEENEHAAWARDQIKAMRGVRDSVSASRDELTADAVETIDALREAQVVFRAFEKRHREAKASFEANIEVSLQKAQKIRDNVNFILTSVLGLIPFTRLVTAMALATRAVKSVSAALKVARAVKMAEKVVGEAGKVKGYLEKADKVAGFGAVADMKPKPKPTRKPGNLGFDWEVLFNAAIESFEQYVASAAGLDGLDKQCHSVLDGLTDTALGLSDSGPDSTLGKQVKALKSMGRISSTAAAPKAREFLDASRERLESTRYYEIEQQMGIAWVAALGDKDLEAIADCKTYLRGIRVIGPMSKTGLNIRTDEGLVDMMLDGEKQMVRWRAQIIGEGNQAIGRRANWLGGYKIGKYVNGRIEFRGHEYSASGPAAPRDDFCYRPGQYLPEEKGGWVLIDKFKWSENLMESTSNSDKKMEDWYKTGLRHALHFSVLPTEGTIPGHRGFRTTGPGMWSNE